MYARYFLLYTVHLTKLKRQNSENKHVRHNQMAINNSLSIVRTVEFALPNSFSDEPNMC